MSGIQDIGLPFFDFSQCPRIIGVHVRHGDKAEAPQLSFSSYREAIRAVRRQDSSASCVFLATDDPSVVSEARLASREDGFQLFAFEGESEWFSLSLIYLSIFHSGIFPSSRS